MIYTHVLNRGARGVLSPLDGPASATLGAAGWTVGEMPALYAGIRPTAARPTLSPRPA
jgi:hypothetical protein